MTKNIEHSELYQSEGAKLLYNNSLPGILITFIASTVLTFTFIDSNNFQAKVTWWLVMTLTLSVRFTDTFMWIKSSAERKHSKAWVPRFSVGCLITAVLWSAYAVIFYQTFSVEELSTTTVIPVSYTHLTLPTTPYV